MFPKTFFPNGYFTGNFFPPVTGSVPLIADNAPLVGMIFNIGTMMGRR